MNDKTCCKTENHTLTPLFFFFFLEVYGFIKRHSPGSMRNYKACRISILQELPNKTKSIQRGQNRGQNIRNRLRKQQYNLHKKIITAKSRRSL